MKHRTTIKDIAKALNISLSTVSRALKDHPDISPKTKKKVREMAEKLKYRPNASALNLKKQRSDIIGIIVPQIVHYFFSSIISGIEDYAYEKGYTLILTQSNEQYDREVQNVETLLNSGVAGILISRTKQTTNFKHLQKLIDYDVPVVFFDRFCPSIKTDKVIINDEYAAYLATEHLINVGCKRIVHFSGPKKLQISRRRITGYLEAHRQNKISIDKDLIIKADTYEQAMLETQKLLDKKIKFDGIFAVNDLAAAGAIETLKKNNIAIPEQVSVMGYSNDLIGKFISPKLSTVAQPGYQMGYAACKMLIERIENSINFPKPRTEVIPTNLIIRESTKK